MVGMTKLVKKKIYPRPHESITSWTMGMEIANEKATGHPILRYDEGLGAASAYEANPENAAFTEVDGSACFPESRIDFILARLSVSLTKGCLETDKIHTVRFGILPISLAFEDYTAVDELSSIEIQDILELVTESTDRQGMFLYTGTDMGEQFTDSALMNTNEPGLTVDTTLEGIAFSLDDYYDALHYQTTSQKLKSVQGGLKWFTLSRQRNHMDIKIRLRSKVKFMNPHAFQGLIVVLPQVGTHEQYAVAGDTTVIPHLNCTLHTRFNEWNQEFDMRKVSS